MLNIKSNARFSLSALAAAMLFANSASAVIEEIVVTANKKAENLSDVGLSISAVSGEKLAEQKLTSLEDIASVVPGLVFAPSTTNTPIFTLRGVGFNESSIGVYPATSVYIDEAPLPFPVMASHTAYDLERVEVLKGPQGILFGQNSTGGAINFIAAKPTDELAYGGDVSYGRFDKIEVNGFVSGPLTDALGARLAITSADSDGWQKSATRNEENGAEEYTAIRLLLDFEASETARISLNLNGWEDKTEPQAQQYIAVSPQVPIDGVTGVAPATLGPILATPFTKEDPRAADWSADVSPSGDREFFQVSLRGDFDLSDDLVLTALTSYSEFEQDQVTDGDGLALVLFDLETMLADIDSLIAEVRLANVGDASFRWVVGANYEKSNTFENQVLRYYDSTNFTDQVNFINSSGVTLDQAIETYAFFANGDFDISDQMTFKVGARYTDSTTEAENCGYGSGDGAVNVLFGLPADAGAGVCYTFFPDFSNGVPFVDELSEDNVSWRIGLDYRLNDDTLFYGNISQGYKAGSYPSLAAASTSQLQPVVQESVLSYEAGLKTLVADGTVQLNAALFYYEYEDKQVRGKANVPPFGILDTLVNVPESTIFGAEADVTYQITDALTLTGSITYLDSEIEKYQGINILGRDQDFSGEPIPFTPELTYSLDADYRIMLDDGAGIFMGVNVTGQSSSDAAFGAGGLSYGSAETANGAKSITEKFYELESFAVWGARLGYESADGHWKVMAWGKNIGDEYYYTNVIASSDTVARFAGRPASYGLTVGYTY